MTLRRFLSMRSTRIVIGLLFILHGFAHVALGTAAQGAGANVTLSTALFLVATLGFVAAGFGAWGVSGLCSIWGGLVKASVLASIVLVVLCAPPPSRALVALLLDALLLTLADALTVGSTACRTA